MKLYKSFVIIILCLLGGCRHYDYSSSECDILDEISMPVSTYIQRPEHLYIDTTESTAPPSESKSVLNYSNPKGTWIQVADYETLIQNKTEDEFKASIHSKFNELKSQGFNTLYFHTRAYGDSYYKSELYPNGTFLTDNYDPLKIAVDEAHSLELSIHAWINPLRCQTTEQIKAVDDKYTIKKWYNEKFGTYICDVNGRCYLNPAYDEVIKLISDGVTEIVANYDVDGIHIDDYFYPTTSEEFDKAAFAQSGASDVSQWRLNNCSILVKSLYDAVKSCDNNVLFGISPQGNITSNYNSQYADVKLWGSQKGYCDYIVPQIYYGFENENCPFSATLKSWEELVCCEDVSLIIGLAGYKVGNEDKWAGSGSSEWIENNDIIPRQIDSVEKSSADGYAIFY